MNAECFPITAIPGLSQIFLDYCSGAPAARSWFGAAPRERRWQGTPALHSDEHRAQLAQLLAAQNPSPQAKPLLEQLHGRANAVVTGQQVGILGGPLFTVHKAATAVALANDATQSGNPHVPIFWLASEDHDFAEVNHVTFPSRRELRKLTYEAQPAAALPVGRLVLDQSILPLIDQAWELLGYSDAMEWLAAAYLPGNTLATAFAEFYGKVFAASGLLILDAAGREAHRLALRCWPPQSSAPTSFMKACSLAMAKSPPPAITFK